MLAQTPVVSYGVDGKWILWKQSDRTDFWSEQLAPELASRVEGIYILHYPTPRNRLPEIIQQIAGAITGAVTAVITIGGTIRDARERLCAELPELCAVFSGGLEA